MIVSFLLSLHAVEFVFGAVILARARGFVRYEGLLYTALVIAHLILHHEIPNGPVDRFFDAAILSLGIILVGQIVAARRSQTATVNARE